MRMTRVVFKRYSFTLVFALISLAIIHTSSLSSSSPLSLPSDDAHAHTHAHAHTYHCTDPLPLLSFKAKPDTNNNDNNQQIGGGSCSYRVQITTSCSSVSYTRDQISLSFGDAYGNQVYVPKIDDPYSRTFEACSTDTFDISGPCTYDVCYVYLYRRGYDGWNVGSVTISGHYIRSVTYNYKSWIPSDVWWGYNYCRGVFSSTSQ